MRGHITESSKIKCLRSKCFNYNFDKETGFFQRWGVTEKEDPIFCEFGPEIADIEITTVCNNGCPFCYKNNTANGQHMEFDTFKIIFNTLSS